MQNESNSVTLADLPELKGLYEKAVELESQAFLFHGKLVLTQYAKYLIEYLESI